MKFDIQSDRLGPDCPFTHWKLYFKSSATNICRKRFAFFGELSEFRPGAYAVSCSNISIGDRVVIRPTSMLFADPRSKGIDISLEDNVMLGSGVHIYVSNHIFEDISLPIIEQSSTDVKPVVVKNGAWIGANVVILPGVSIGKNSVVGAGSIVTKSIPDFCLAVGSPAKVIKKLDCNK